MSKPRPRWAVIAHAGYDQSGDPLWSYVSLSFGRPEQAMAWIARNDRRRRRYRLYGAIVATYLPEPKVSRKAYFEWLFRDGPFART